MNCGTWSGRSPPGILGQDSRSFGVHGYAAAAEKASMHLRSSERLLDLAACRREAGQMQPLSSRRWWGGSWSTADCLGAGNRTCKVHNQALKEEHDTRTDHAIGLPLSMHVHPSKELRRLRRRPPPAQQLATAGPHDSPAAWLTTTSRIASRCIRRIAPCPLRSPAIPNRPSRALLARAWMDARVTAQSVAVHRSWNKA